MKLQHGKRERRNRINSPPLIHTHTHLLLLQPSQLCRGASLPRPYVVTCRKNIVPSMQSRIMDLFIRKTFFFLKKRYYLEGKSVCRTRLNFQHRPSKSALLLFGGFLKHLRVWDRSGLPPFSPKMWNVRTSVSPLFGIAPLVRVSPSFLFWARPGPWNGRGVIKRD